MIEAFRARPWSVHVFAALLLGIGLHTLIGGLYYADEWLLIYRDALPQFPWNWDWVIAAHSARFSIVCIPVAAVWIWQKAFARTLVTVFAAFGCIAIIRALADGTAPLEAETLIKTLGIATACALLFTASAERWLHGEKEPDDAEVFE